jgi:hypothetical protein
MEASQFLLVPNQMRHMEEIVGPGFARRVARYISVAAGIALMQATGVGLNLVGMARNGTPNGGPR